MRRYPGNHTDSELLTVPRDLKVRPHHDTTHLAYITDKEADLLQKNKPGTPHKGPHGIPNYDGGDILTYTPSGMSGTGYVGPTQQQQQQQQQHDKQVQKNIGDTYKPPKKVYGPGQAEPGKTGYASINVAADKDSWNKYYSTWKSIQNMDPKTLAFFGYNPGSYNVPNELLTMVAEGSIVSGNEAVETKHLYDTGQNWADYKDFEGNWVKGGKVDPNVGTWSDLESGIHPMFSLEDYYDITGNPNVISTSGTGGGGGGWGYGGGCYGGGYGGGGGESYYGSAVTGNPLPRGNPNEAWGAQNPLQQAMINVHGGKRFRQGYARGGIVSLVE